MTRAGFGDGDRHGWLDTWTSLMTRVIHGRAAQDHLDAGVSGPAAVALYPVWAWTKARANVGRKDLSSDGGRLLLPIRVSWSSGPVFVVPEGQQSTATWHAEGLGIRENGQAVVTAQAGLLPAVAHLVQQPTPPQSVKVGVLPRREVVSELQGLADDGRVALWEAIKVMEPYVSRAVTRAHTHLSSTRVEDRRATRPLLDETGLESVRDEMTLGTDGAISSAPLVRIIELSMDPASTVNADPQRYLMTAVNRDALKLVRRRVGDPEPGLRIRELARELGVQDPKALLEEYNRRHGYDRLGAKRLVQALTLSPADAMAGWAPLPEGRAS